MLQQLLWTAGAARAPQEVAREAAAKPGAVWAGAEREEGPEARAGAGDGAGAPAAVAGTAGAAAEDEGAAAEAEGAAVASVPEEPSEKPRSAMDETRAVGLYRRAATSICFRSACRTPSQQSLGHVCQTAALPAHARRAYIARQ